MRKYILSSLFLTSLLLVISLIFSVSLVKAENDNEVNVNETRDTTNEIKVNSTNETDDDVNEVRTNSNENEVDVNEDRDDVNEDRDDVNEVKGTDDELDGETHRSAVATYVQSLLSVADREKGGIGEQVRVVAQAQNTSKDTEAVAIDKIKNRSKITTFLIGTDYKNIGVLRSEVAKTGSQIDQLKKLAEKATTPESKTTLQAQIQSITLEQQKINDFIEENESEFSLFGWFVKLFVK